MSKVEDFKKTRTLLSLDGGGIRGLSSIMILEQLLDQYNGIREEKHGLAPQEPWEVFDLIGGTSTGGIIAIMLGRLRMSTSQCREAYEKLASEAFQPVNYHLRPLKKVADKLQAQPEFDVKALESAIRSVIATHADPGSAADAVLLKDVASVPCKVFVTTTNETITETQLLRSYRNTKRSAGLYNTCTIFQACRATSAASTFFPPITIQGSTFIDGGLLSNNPVQHVHEEAMALWPDDEHLLISIGTGETPKTAFQGNLKVLIEGLSKIATETHRTAEAFRARDGNKMSKAGLYYRFNVPDLGTVGLEEWQKSNEVRALTINYIDSSATSEAREQCVQKLSDAAEDVLKPVQPKYGREVYLDWYSKQPHLSYHQYQIKKVLLGTGIWLLEDTEFVKWRDSSKSTTLWLHGGMGSGKSCLISNLIATLLDQFERGETSRPNYFYCVRDPQQTQRADPQLILGSIARQMCCLQDNGPVLRAAVELCERQRERGSAMPTMDESIDLIVKLSKARPVTYIIIDALDECNQETRGELLDALISIADRSRAIVKILVVSRDDPDIILRFDATPHVPIAASKTRRDLELFIEDEVKKRAKKDILFGKATPALIESIKSALRSGADGMFRWAELQLQYLCSIKNANAIKQRLGKLPPTLQAIYKEVYDASMKGLEEEEKPIPKAIFAWLLNAYWDFDSANFHIAVGWTVSDLKLTTEQILHYSFQMVAYDVEQDIFRFRHLSVREFLEKEEAYSASRNHAQLALACMHALINTDEAEACFHARYEAEPYASATWALHVRDAGIRRSEGELCTMLNSFLGARGTDCSQAFGSWSTWSEDWGYHYFYGLECDPPDATFFICALGFGDYLRPMLESQTLSRQLTNQNGDSLLTIACWYGHIQIVRELIDYGFDVNYNTDDEDYPNALYAASTEGPASIGMGNERVVKMLLDCGARVDAVGGTFGNALEAASSAGEQSIVKILIDYGANVNAQGGRYNTALQAASSQNHPEVVRILLECGANIDAVGGPSGTALQAACLLKYYKNEIVEILLNQGANVNVQGGEHGNALQAACCRPKLDVVELLLDRGANVNAVGGPFNTALQAAFGLGSEGNKIIELLVARGAEVNIAASAHGIATASPLQLACSRCNSIAVTLLLDAGAEVNAAGGSWGNALEAAFLQAWERFRAMKELKIEQKMEDCTHCLELVLEAGAVGRISHEDIGDADWASEELKARLMSACPDGGRRFEYYYHGPYRDSESHDSDGTDDSRGLDDSEDDWITTESDDDDDEGRGSGY